MYRPEFALPLLTALVTATFGCHTIASISVDTPRPEPAAVAECHTRLLRVACLGDSITAGSGTLNPTNDAYPSQLQRLLDSKAWIVRGFGVSGATLMDSGDKPYRQQVAFRAAREFFPDVVIIMLGTNDSKPINWSHHQDFVAEFIRLIDEVRSWPGAPKVFVCQPPIVVGAGKFGITSAVVELERPLIAEIGAAAHVEVIPMNEALIGHEQVLRDGVHPDRDGAALLAACAAKSLQRASASIR